MANCIQCGRKLPALTLGRKICQWCVQHEAAQRGDEPEDAVQRVETAPWLRRQSTSMVVTQVLFGINVAVFLGMLFAGVSILDNPTGQDLVRWGANFGPYTVSGQRAVVAASHLRLHSRKLLTHRVQYVVLVGPGQAG